MLRRDPEQAFSVGRVLKETLRQQLEQFMHADRQIATVLAKRYFENVKIKALSEWLDLSDKNHSKQWREINKSFMAKFAMFLLQSEIAEREKGRAHMLASLPLVAYQTLVGRDEDIVSVSDNLASAAPNTLLALCGVGGIGKTALAHYVCSNRINSDDFVEFAWVDLQFASQSDRWTPDLLLNQIVRKLAEQFGLAGSDAHQEASLARHLRILAKQLPLLIVIDNLDSQHDLSVLYGKLTQFCGLGRILVISREQPPRIASIRAYHLQPVSQDAAEALLTKLADSYAVDAVKHADERQTDALLQTVGGHPYALIVAVKLLGYFPMEHVIKQFRTRSHQDVSDLYDHIFLIAWGLLSAESKQLLRLMTLAPSTGTKADYLLTLFGGSEKAFWLHLARLLDLSLLHRFTVRGTTVFKIHALTRTFIQSNMPAATAPFEAAIDRGLAHWLEASQSWTANETDAHATVLQVLVVHAAVYPTSWHAAVKLVDGLFKRIKGGGMWWSWLEAWRLLIEHVPADSEQQKSKLYSQLGVLLRLNDELDSAEIAHQNALKIAMASNDLMARAREAFHLCTIDRLRGQYDSAQKHGEFALELVEEVARRPGFEEAVKNALGLVAHYQTNFEQSAKFFSSNVAYYSNVSRLETARTLNNLGNVYVAQKRFDEADNTLRQAWRLASESGAHAVEDVVALSMLNYMVTAETVVEAEPFVALLSLRCKQYQTVFRNRQLMAVALAHYYLLQEAFSDATTWLEYGEELLADSQYDDVEIRLLCLRACVSAMTSEPRAQEAWQTALALSALHPTNRWLAFLVTQYQELFNRFLVS